MKVYEIYEKDSSSFGAKRVKLVSSLKKAVDICLEEFDDITWIYKRWGYGSNYTIYSKMSKAEIEEYKEKGKKLPEKEKFIQTIRTEINKANKGGYLKNVKIISRTGTKERYITAVEVE